MIKPKTSRSKPLSFRDKIAIAFLILSAIVVLPILLLWILARIIIYETDEMGTRDILSITSYRFTNKLKSVHKYFSDSMEDNLNSGVLLNHVKLFLKNIEAESLGMRISSDYDKKQNIKTINVKKADLAKKIKSVIRERWKFCKEEMVDCYIELSNGEGSLLIKFHNDCGIWASVDYSGREIFLEGIKSQLIKNRI